MTTRRTTKALACMAALAGAALALSACGGGSSSGPTEITFFVAIQPGGTIEETSARCSKESNGRYEVVPEFLPNDASQAREQLVRRLGAKDPSIDVIGLDVILTSEFANAGWVEKWTGKRKREATERVFPSVLETASFKGDVYAAPFNTNTQLLWYRKDLVPKPPATWDEMIAAAEKLGRDKAGTIQVQAERYEGFMVWTNSLIESAGTEILSAPETVDLEQKPTEEALAVMGRLANSPAAASNLSTSNEDSARLAFEAGESAFMTNYTFAYASASEEAPDIAKDMGAAPYPRVNGDRAKPPLGGFNLAVSSYSDHQQEAFEAAQCLAGEKSQLTAVELDGLPPSREDLYAGKVVKKAYPGFAALVKQMIESAGPRPATPAYQDVSSALQRTLHPPEKIDPEDTEGIYDELKSNLEAAVKREGLL